MSAAPVRIGFGRASPWGSWLTERALADATGVEVAGWLLRG